MSSKYAEKFFDRKRPWSNLKDEVLGNYLKPYLHKVKELNREIILLDCFAGPGRYGKKDIGSPLIMCQAVMESKEEVRKKTRMVFVNKEENHHKVLENEIKNLKLSDQQAEALFANSKELLVYLTPKLQDQTLFVYLDPFGLEGCEFETLMPLLTRSTDSSTEIIININMPEFHRRAGREAIQMGKEIPAEIEIHHSFLNKIFGGDYWKKFEFDPMMDNKPKLRELKVMDEYCKKLDQFFPFTRFCPVRESKTGPTKYFIVFCSRHPDALWLMNDIMQNAYQKYIFGSPHGELDLFNPLMLTNEIVEIVKIKPGISRKELTITIFDRHFLQYSKGDIGKTVSELNGKKLRFESPTGRLNDGALLFPI